MRSGTLLHQFGLRRHQQLGDAVVWCQAGVPAVHLPAMGAPGEASFSFVDDPEGQNGIDTTGRYQQLDNRTPDT